MASGLKTTQIDKTEQHTGVTENGRSTNPLSANTQEFCPCMTDKTVSISSCKDLKLYIITGKTEAMAIPKARQQISECLQVNLMHKSAEAGRTKRPCMQLLTHTTKTSRFQPLRHKNTKLRPLLGGRRARILPKSEEVTKTQAPSQLSLPNIGCRATSTSIIRRLLLET